MPPAIVVLLGTAVGGAIGFASAVFSERVRQCLFGPRLRADFDESPEFQTKTTAGTPGQPATHLASFVRVKARNTKWSSVAKACRAFLTNVEMLNETTQSFDSTDYCDSIQLKWSALAEDEKLYPRDLPSGVSQFIDLVSTFSGNTNFQPQLHVHLRRYERLFAQKGCFRFTILVTSDNAAPTTIRVIFFWDGQWDKYKAWKDQSERNNVNLAATHGHSLA